MMVLFKLSLDDCSNELGSVDVDMEDSSVDDGISGRRRAVDVRKGFVSV